MRYNRNSGKISDFTSEIIKKLIKEGYESKISSIYIASFSANRIIEKIDITTFWIN
jgi:hypothetical protein